MKLQAIPQTWDLFDGERIIGHVERTLMGYKAMGVDEQLAGYFPNLNAAVDCIQGIVEAREHRG